MAIIPMKQTITINRGGGTNEWGETLPGETFTYKCRFEEGTELTRNLVGDEVVSTAKIYLDKLVSVNYDDKITYTDELGNSRTYTPINVKVKRAVSGKPLFTVVNV